MPRRRTASDATKIKKARGSGHGKDYTPYLTVREVPSKGQRHREFGWKTERVHHFLSNGEMKCFMVFEWCHDVLDIREQFPLQREVTAEIATRLGIRHPLIPGTQELAVMTTDFVLDVIAGEAPLMVARAVKLSQDLQDARVIEKLEIERTYWREKKVDWGIITPDKEFPEALSKNVSWVHSAFYVEDAPSDLTAEMIMQVEEMLYGQLSASTSTALSHVALMGDKALGFKSGTCLWVVRHLIATRKWWVEMNQQIAPDKPLLINKGSLLQVDLLSV